MSGEIRIEVAYALPDAQTVIPMAVPEGTTVKAAVEASGVLQKHPDIDLEKHKVGIYGKLVKADTVLRDRDRIEIYRPLKADPKEIRRQRAEEGKPMKKGGALDA